MGEPYGTSWVLCYLKLQVNLLEQGQLFSALLNSIPQETGKLSVLTNRWERFTEEFFPKIARYTANAYRCRQMWTRLVFLLRASVCAHFFSKVKVMYL